MLTLNEYLVKQHTSNDYDYVDLGLPSGTLWYTKNLGAKTIYDLGEYFAWGECSPKEYYGMHNYKFLTSDYNTTKYNYNDNLTNLELSDDAANRHNNKFCIPTKKQCEELIEKTKYEIVNNENNQYFKFIGNNGNKLIIPFCGSKNSIGDIRFKTTLRIWTNEIDDEDYAWTLGTLNDHPNNINVFIRPRHTGQLIRPVLKQ